MEFSADAPEQGRILNPDVGHWVTLEPAVIEASFVAGSSRRIAGMRKRAEPKPHPPSHYARLSNARMKKSTYKTRFSTLSVTDTVHPTGFRRVMIQLGQA